MVHEFYGSPITFLKNEKDIFIGARSVCNGIGLSWSGQFSRLKSLGLSCSCSRIRIDKKYINSMIAVVRGSINAWMRSIDKNKFSNGKADRIELYQSEFERFVFDAIDCDNQIEREDFYTKTREGLKTLITDSVIHLGNSNAIDQLVDVLDPLLNDNFIPDKLPLFEREHAPQTRQSFMRILDGIRLRVLEIPNPIYDAAEKTAARANELQRIKSESTGSQIETIAQKLREYEEHISDKKVKDKLRKDSLSLSRISKSLY